MARDRRGDRLAPDEQLEFAWRAHEANVGWVRNVDQKASIVLVLATALSGVAANQALGDNGPLAHATGLKLTATIATGVFFVLAALLALFVVRPHLRPRTARRLARDGLIYFGQLKRRSAGDIETALERLTTTQARRDLSRQLEAHGRIAWRKHRLLQLSLDSLILGAISLALARFIF